MAVNLCRGLDPDRWQPLIVTLEPGAEYAGDLPPEVEHVNLNKRGRWDNAGVVLRLADLLRRRRPCLVHTRIYYTALLTGLARLCVGVRIPQVSAVSNTLSYCLEDEPFTALRRLACRRLLPRIDQLVAISSGVRNDLVTHFGVPPGKCSMIPNSVDLRRVRTLMREPMSDGVSCKDVPLLVAAGRLTRQKNYPLLLRAFSRLRRRRHARLLILGDGELRAALDGMTRELRIRDSVEFRGFVDNPFRFFRAADAFVLSSDWEGFGNVVVEAMACGTPVVCTRYRYGAEEIVSDGENGLLVPRGDEKALAGAMKRVLDDPDLRQKLARGALRRAGDFDNDRISPRYAALFEKVLQMSSFHEPLG